MKKKLGKEVVQILLNNVNDGTINSQRMRDFAYKLDPTDQKVGGNHIRRRGEGAKSDEAEMRRILADWYLRELFDMERNAAVLKLAAIFEDPDIDLPPLAKELRSKLIQDNPASPANRDQYCNNDNSNNSEDNKGDNIGDSSEDKGDNNGENKVGNIEDNMPGEPTPRLHRRKCLGLPLPFAGLLLVIILAAVVAVIVFLTSKDSNVTTPNPDITSAYPLLPTTTKTPTETTTPPDYTDIFSYITVETPATELPPGEP